MSELPKVGSFIQPKEHFENRPNCTVVETGNRVPGLEWMGPYFVAEYPNGIRYRQFIKDTGARFELKE